MLYGCQVLASEPKDLLNRSLELLWFFALCQQCDSGGAHEQKPHLLLEPGDVSVKVDAVLPGTVGVLPDPLGKFPEVLPLLGF